MRNMLCDRSHSCTICHCRRRRARATPPPCVRRFETRRTDRVGDDGAGAARVGGSRSAPAEGERLEKSPAFVVVTVDYGTVNGASD